LFRAYVEEAERLLKEDLTLPAYDYTLRCSHTFNVLEARGAISVTERTGFIQTIRRLATSCARQYLEAGGGKKSVAPDASAARSEKRS
jgi:glycyl-tRNA synthetase alpha chain